MTLSIILHLSQQLSGMGGVRKQLVHSSSNYFTLWCPFFLLKVLFYSTEIFAAAGVQYSEVATIVVGITLLVFTVVTVYECV